jgi:hypothetical protein
MWEEYYISWTYIELERIRGGKQFFRSLTLSVQKQPESIGKFCLVAPLFIWPFLSYAAEQSAV